MKVIVFSDIDVMTGRAFERYLGELFAEMGYVVAETEQYDLGVDLVIVKEGLRTAVQAKRSRHPVRIDAVRAVVAAKRTYDCTRGMVVTIPPGFTPPARRLASDNGIDLWARRELREAILYVQAIQARHRCALCGKSVSDRVARYCIDRPNEFHGVIYCFTHQKRPGAGVLKTS